MQNWTYCGWFFVLELVGSLADLASILDLPSRVQGTSLVVDLVLYALSLAELCLKRAGVVDERMRSVYSGLAWLARCFGLFLHLLQGILYLEHVIFW